jgi:hypothetical protein
VSAPVRTEGVTARGDFWVRAQAPGSPGDGPGLGGGRKVLEPDSELATYDVVFRVPDAAAWIEVGAGIAGPGRLWVGPASWEVLGEGSVDGETLTGTMSSLNARGGVPASPLRGRRVPTLQSAGPRTPGPPPSTLQDLDIGP